VQGITLILQEHIEPEVFGMFLALEDDEPLSFPKKLSKASTVFGESEKGGWFP
jgi:hypothetical protein